MFSCSIALQFLSYQITALYNYLTTTTYRIYLSYSEKFVHLNLARLIEFGGA